MIRNDHRMKKLIIIMAAVQCQCTGSEEGKKERILYSQSFLIALIYTALVSVNQSLHETPAALVLRLLQYNVRPAV